MDGRNVNNSLQLMAVFLQLPAFLVHQTSYLPASRENAGLMDIAISKRGLES
jgi:hypothetical protein